MCVYGVFLNIAWPSTEGIVLVQWVLLVLNWPCCIEGHQIFNRVNEHVFVCFVSPVVGAVCTTDGFSSFFCILSFATKHDDALWIYSNM